MQGHKIQTHEIQEARVNNQTIEKRRQENLKYTSKLQVHEITKNTVWV